MTVIVTLEWLLNFSKNDEEQCGLGYIYDNSNLASERSLF